MGGNKVAHRAPNVDAGAVPEQNDRSTMLAQQLLEKVQNGEAVDETALGMDMQPHALGAGRDHQRPQQAEPELVVEFRALAGRVAARGPRVGEGTDAGEATFI